MGERSLLFDEDFEADFFFSAVVDVHAFRLYPFRLGNR
jgi:hypothetical protein